MAGAWLSIRVELVSGRGEHFWPRPGRTFAAATSHSFSQLAEAIDTGFARWDRSHLYQFVLVDGRAIGQPDPDAFDEEELIDGERHPFTPPGADDGTQRTDRRYERISGNRTGVMARGGEVESARPT